MKPVPEQYRLRNHKHLGSDASYGNNGMFLIPHYKVNNYLFVVMVSDGMGWEHVSVSLVWGNRKTEVNRCPTWEEMCWIKDLFFEKTEAVMQLHPPVSEYVNNHPYCLHLWRPTAAQIPLPEAIMVGIKGLELKP